MTKVGDTVYQFDVNNRVYRRDESGKAVGGPIYREHFRPYLIVGEEKRSWILDLPVPGIRGKPFTRKTAKSQVMTAEEVDADCWRNEHRYRLSQAITQLNDVEKLKQIAAIAGYGEPPALPPAESATAAEQQGAARRARRRSGL